MAYVEVLAAVIAWVVLPGLAVAALLDCRSPVEKIRPERFATFALAGGLSIWVVGARVLDRVGVLEPRPDDRGLGRARAREHRGADRPGSADTPRAEGTSDRDLRRVGGREHVARGRAAAAARRRPARLPGQLDPLVLLEPGPPDRRGGRHAGPVVRVGDVGQLPRRVPGLHARDDGLRPRRRHRVAGRGSCGHRHRDAQRRARRLPARARARRAAVGRGVRDDPVLRARCVLVEAVVAAARVVGLRVRAAHPGPRARVPAYRPEAGAGPPRRDVRRAQPGPRHRLALRLRDDRRRGPRGLPTLAAGGGRPTPDAGRDEAVDLPRRGGRGDHARRLGGRELRPEQPPLGCLGPRWAPGDRRRRGPDVGVRGAGAGQPGEHPARGDGSPDQLVATRVPGAGLAVVRRDLGPRARDPHRPRRRRPGVAQPFRRPARARLPRRVGGDRTRGLGVLQHRLGHVRAAPHRLCPLVAGRAAPRADRRGSRRQPDPLG